MELSFEELEKLYEEKVIAPKKRHQKILKRTYSIFILTGIVCFGIVISLLQSVSAILLMPIFYLLFGLPPALLDEHFDTEAVKTVKKFHKAFPEFEEELMKRQKKQEERRHQQESEQLKAEFLDGYHITSTSQKATAFNDYFPAAFN